MEWTVRQKVAEHAVSGRGVIAITTIADVGKRFVKTTDGAEWVARTGDRKGGGPYCNFIRPATDEDVRQVRRKMAINRLHYSVRWNELSDDVLGRIVAILDTTKSES